MNSVTELMPAEQAPIEVDPWLAADLAYNRAKLSDPLRQRDADWAMREELRVPAAARGAA